MSDPAIKLDRLDSHPFMDGPAAYVAKTVARIIGDVPQWKAIFGDMIDPYKKSDYALGSLPALRIYDNGYRKASESWFIDGTLFLDVIWPPALRRAETQQLPDIVASALLQQFRRITFMNDVENASDDQDSNLKGFHLLGVPGLNELGKVFSVDKTLGFQLGENPDDIAPLTQIQVNFRVDLRQWDRYLEDQLRTKDDPFEQTLGVLEQVAGVIEFLTEDEAIDSGQIELEQEPGV